MLQTGSLTVAIAIPQLVSFSQTFQGFSIVSVVIAWFLTDKLC